MKISEAIKELESIKAEHGDIEVCLNTDQSYGDLDGSFIPVKGFKTEGIFHSQEDSDKLDKANIAVLDFHDFHIMENE